MLNKQRHANAKACQVGRQMENVSLDAAETMQREHNPREHRDAYGMDLAIHAGRATTDVNINTPEALSGKR
jgi:hypothetical protein